MFFYAAGRPLARSAGKMGGWFWEEALKLWKVGGSGKSGRHAGPERVGAGRMVGA
jgi:hypothetical protein